MGRHRRGILPHQAAARSDRPGQAEVRHFPRLLLALMVARHYVWPLFPDAMQTSLWTICSSLVVMAFIAAAVIVGMWLGAPTVPALVIGAWWIVEELMVIGCELAYLANGKLPTGDERCTAQLGWKFGTFGLVVVSVLTIAVISDSGKNSRGNHNVD